MKKINSFAAILTLVAFSDAAVNLNVSLGDSIKPVTHVATGSLYGLTETLPSDIGKDVVPLKPNVFLSPARTVVAVSRALVVRSSLPRVSKAL